MDKMAARAATDGDCPHRERIRDYLLGTCPASAAAEIDQHLCRCRACAELVERLAKDTDPFLIGLQQGRADPPAGLPTTFDYAGALAPMLGLRCLVGEDLRELLLPPETEDELGRLAGYRVLKVLGGGMGIVFQAEDVRLKRTVALKVIRPQFAGSRGLRERFLREAEKLAAVDHPHVVPILHAGEERGVLYLAMPLLAGRTLHDALRDPTPLPLHEVIRLGREIALGLSALHERGLVHRDLKPDNIFLVEATEKTRPHVKILDLGLARQAADPALSDAGAIIGTPAYMSPEQAAGDEVDARCDLFALGSVLYLMCTGRRPFVGKDTLDTLLAIREQQPPAPTKVNAAVPAALSELIMRLLAKQPEQRPASAREVVAALEAISSDAATTDCHVRKPRRRGLVLVALLLIALVPLAYLQGSWVFDFAANRGRLIVKSDVPEEIEVVFKDGRGQILERKTGRQITLTAGQHNVEVIVRDKAGTLRFVTAKFTLSRGGTVVVDAEHAKARDEKPAVPAPPKLPIAAPIERAGYTEMLILSPDGKALAGATRPRDGVLLIDPETLQQRFLLNTSNLAAIAFSSDSKSIASAGLGADAFVRVWNVADGTMQREFPIHTDDYATVAFSPDARWLLVAQYGDGALDLWEVESGKRYPGFNSSLPGVFAIAFFPDGKSIVTGGNRLIQLWDRATGKTVRVFARHERTIEKLAVSPDGQFLASTNKEYIVRLWRTDTGKQMHQWNAPVSSLAFSPDGKRLLSNRGDVWEVATGKVLPFWNTQRLTMASQIAVSPDGKRVYVGTQEGLRAWDIESRTEIHPGVK